MHIGLIAEGKFDSKAIPEFLGTLLEESPRISRIFPDLDATGTDEYVPGGWTQLIERLRSEACYGLSARFESGLFSDQPPLDLLVIHLDLDIANLFFQIYRNTPLAFDGEAEKVDKFQDAIRDFLVELDVDAPLDRIVFATPDPCTDGWMLLGISADIDSVWGVPSSDVKSLLRQARNGCYASLDNYRHIASDAAANAAQISNRSASFRCFREELSRP
ncbi:hypothetical protein GCM10011367_15920 [Marinicauda pacifica]|uniref:DUF4276 family protein n=1 Tax=Marinicauda pacifica TaxID=1133559 RepID=A0A4S2HAR2_9PROT|nr:hypothetical protein [Marinicauda pacifica]TGY93004.1 hypothetical protein E5162_08035 [Marinicauda pacifica]GGE42068.1 hypothetical protein GCM10011367_15920 [Marinicauda pacifica]